MVMDHGPNGGSSPLRNQLSILYFIFLARATTGRGPVDSIPPEVHRTRYLVHRTLYKYNVYKYIVRCIFIGVVVKVHVYSTMYSLVHIVGL